MANKYKFDKGDCLLCYDGMLLYEAKCLERRKIKGIIQYFIHYKGWNKKWDTWVNEDRVIKVNFANKRKMELLKEIHSPSKKNAVAKEKTVQNTTSTVKKIKIKGIPRQNVVPQMQIKKVTRTSEATETTKLIGSTKKMHGTDEINVNTAAFVCTSATNASVGTKKASDKESIEHQALKVNFANKSKVEVLKETKKVLENVKSKKSDEYKAPPKKRRKLKLISSIPLKKMLAMDVDNIVRGKVLKFPEYFTVDTLIRNYIYNADPETRKDATTMGLSLIKMFQSVIDKRHIFYPKEIKYDLSKKAKDHYLKKLESGSIEGHSLNRHVHKNEYWHYTYHPTYLLRLLDSIPKEKASKMMEHFLMFVEKNLDLYFSEQEYIDMF
ncbi:Chromo/chromo shadow domain,Chromo domain-like,MRG domain,RNA binding activity-knot of a [Cinara cedri]|uniref:Chromo/chromo shadow domain,Chromo domain-like,MRG domain,RNA binding activity-knot of a n=1 Tax=Cinara cedri TaxID=506608 RepID=A0A5E4NPD3_9HEMI|nr:Chromo/chromo shadow domain,Chromo domain-like,MRG domain,RNA binding activity-knot of a [Cinara cedri]